MTVEFGGLEHGNGDDRSDSAANLLSVGMTGMLLVAFVDGKLHWNERETLVEAMRAIGDHVTAEQALTFLDDTAHMLESIPESEWQGLFNPGRRLPNEMKRIILNLCMRLAFSDGHLSPIESDLIHRIADWIEIDPGNRVIWKQEVRNALDEAQARGLEYTGIENLDWHREEI